MRAAILPHDAVTPLPGPETHLYRMQKAGLAADFVHLPLLKNFSDCILKGRELHGQASFFRLQYSPFLTHPV
jgi:hypothetical protein